MAPPSTFTGAQKLLVYNLLQGNSCLLAFPDKSYEIIHFLELFEANLRLERVDSSLRRPSFFCWFIRMRGIYDQTTNKNNDETKVRILVAPSVFDVY